MDIYNADSRSDDVDMITGRIEMPPSPMPIPSVNRALASTDEDDMNIDNFGIENYSTSTMR